MKVPPENWPGALEWLPRWDGVSPAARAAWLSIKPSPGSAPLPPGFAEELVRAGLLDPPGPKGTQYKVVPEAKPLLRVLRAMDRVPVFDAQRGAALAYIREHLTHEQVNLLNGDGRSPGWGSDVGELEERVSSAGWIRALLDLRDADAARKWEMPRRPANEPLMLADPWVLAALQRLVTALKDHAEGVPLRQVHELLPDVDPQHRAGALAAGARYLFLFPALRDEAEPWMGLLPHVARRMGPPPPPPEPVQAAETFETPFRLGDMTAVAVEAATAPIPLRASDYALYVRSIKTIAARLARLPPWTHDVLVTLPPEEEFEDEDAEPVGDRIATAVGLLSALKLMQMRSTGGRHQLVLTRAGERWLALGEGERLKEVLDAFRASTQRVPGSWYDDSGKVDFFGARFPFSLPAAGLDVRRALADAYLAVPAGAMVPLLEFATHESRVRNPLLAAGSTLRRDPWGSMPKTSEGWEAAWASLLVGFLFLRLAPFAGARLGRLDGDRLAFTLTDAGRYLLGERDDFAPAPAAEGGEVVVQPDFEIVFLAPAPRAEAELGRIAERTGAAGVGALFRLTRASVLRAAEQGMSGAKVLATLETVARGGVPANVARQVRDWMNAVRTIRIAPAVLVHCPDAETAGRVRALGGAHVAEVTPTLLRLEADHKTRAALVKRLRDKGIFVGSG